MRICHSAQVMGLKGRDMHGCVLVGCARPEPGCGAGGGCLLAFPLHRCFQGPRKPAVRAATRCGAGARACHTEKGTHYGQGKQRVPHTLDQPKASPKLPPTNTTNNQANGALRYFDREPECSRHHAYMWGLTIRHKPHAAAGATAQLQCRR